MQNFHRMVGILVLMHDESAGAVRVDRSGKPEISYHVNAKERALFLEGMKHCAEILFASGAKKVLVPYDSPLMLRAGRRSRVPSIGAACGQNDIPIASTHPQSTCKMGEDPTRVGRKLVVPVARPEESVRLRHERVPVLARRAAADLDRGDRRPDGALHQGTVGADRGVTVGWLRRRNVKRKT